MAAKKGFFQKADQKKQYSENVLNNADETYRPKSRGRVKNPMSSNTMSGEEVDTFTDPLHLSRSASLQSNSKGSIGSAFTGPLAKQKKLEAQRMEAERPQTSQPKETAIQNAQAQIQPSQEVQAQSFFNAARLGRGKKKTDIAMRVRAPKQPKKLSNADLNTQSEPHDYAEVTEISEEQLSELSLPQSIFAAPAGCRNMPLVESPQLECAQFEAPQIETDSNIVEAMRALEDDVQESRGCYEPIQESEVEMARALGFQKLCFRAPAAHEMAYELEFDQISADEFAHQAPAQPLSGMIPLEEQLRDASVELIAEPLTENSESADLGLVFEPQDYRRDLKKTRMLSIPKQGVKRSHRGTIEAVFQPNGRVVEAQYNRCGILIEVSVAGAMKLTRSAETGKWTMSYSDGSQPVDEVDNVTFDRLGNLSYSTADGAMTVICADGTILQK